MKYIFRNFLFTYNRNFLFTYRSYILKYKENTFFMFSNIVLYIGTKIYWNPLKPRCKNKDIVPKILI